MTERQEELAALYALGALPPAEARAFEAALAGDPALRAAVREFQAAAAALAHAAPPTRPPAHLESQLLAQIHAQNAAALPARRDLRWLGWAAVAALLAVLAAVLGLERQRLGGAVTVLRAKAAAEAESVAAERVRLEHEITILRQIETTTTQQVVRLSNERTELRSEAARQTGERTRLEGELAALQKKDALSAQAIRDLTAQVATREALATLDVRNLTAQLDEMRETLAAVAWSQAQQSGILTLEKLDPPGPGEDYQLWVIDPRAPAPISAGLLVVDEKGGGRYEFKSATPVGPAYKFAISREKKGGSMTPQGPIVLLSP